jgi:signal transduction histidine kinase/PAS domain-containing protein
VRWVAARGRVVSAADGAPVRLAGITLDITEQVQARLRSEELAARLDNQQRWLEAILHHTPVPLLLLEPGSGRVVFANRSADAMAGGHFPRHMPVHENNTVYRLTDEWDSPVPNAETPVARAASGERVQGAEWVFHTPAGRFPLLIDSETVPAMAGHPPTVVLTLQDVGKLKGAEQRLLLLSDASGVLAESLALPETALRQLTLLAVAYLSDWCVVDLTRDDGSIERVAVAHADPAQHPLAEQLRSLSPSPRSSPTHLPTRAMREGSASLIEEVEDSHLEAWAQDAEHLALLRALRIRSLMSVPMVARGRTLGVMTFSTRKEGARFGAAHLATAEDLAHRAAIALDNARLYHQAQEAVRQRDEFLSVASHELKTPLTPLSLKLQAFARSINAPPDAQLTQRLARDADVMRRQVKRLSELVNDLLDVSRISTGQLRLELEPVDLAALVREVAARFEPEAERVGCGLTVTTPSLVTGLWDRLRLDQVVTNLLSNALKYGAGTPVRVHVVSDTTHVRLRVEDQGIGIPTEARERIFGRFERAVSTRHYGGLGLGLYVTRQIVERLGGRVGVESQPGQGAAFTVELPLQPPPAPPEGAPGV